jgi:hypothetical protein
MTAYKVYLANRMSNVPEFNFPWFADAAKFLRETFGWEVANPAEKDLEDIPFEVMSKTPGYDEGDLELYCANSTFTMSNAMAWDLPAILSGDGIVLGPEWHLSTGARWERIVAEALGREVWLLSGSGLSNFYLSKDPIQDRLTQYLKGYTQ